MKKYVLHMILDNKNKRGRHIGWFEAENQSAADEHAKAAWKQVESEGSWTNFDGVRGFKATLESKYKYH